MSLDSASSEQDSLHILPLSAIPLETKGLRQARMVKNASLEGVIELFSDRDAGSGQIRPGDLPEVFHFGERNRGDLKVVGALGGLASYDVYSLRLELRRLGIAVNDHADLKLSDTKARELASYMSVFTRPLVLRVYGEKNTSIESLQDILRLFADPDVKAARGNLNRLAQAVGIDIVQIPHFLEDYGDVYLSLAYYQYCLDQLLPKLEAFEMSLSRISQDPQLKSNPSLVQACNQLKSFFSAVASEIASILDLFKARTKDMWENLSPERFKEMREMIEAYQTRIGGMLCALTVKLDAWSQAFPLQEDFSLKRQADFVMGQMRHGLSRIIAVGGTTAAG